MEHVTAGCERRVPLPSFDNHHDKSQWHWLNIAKDSQISVVNPFYTIQCEQLRQPTSLLSLSKQIGHSADLVMTTIVPELYGFKKLSNNSLMHLLQSSCGIRDDDEHDIKKCQWDIGNEQTLSLFRWTGKYAKCFILSMQYKLRSTEK